MLGALSFAFEVNEGSDRLDPRVWRAIVTGALARSGEGLVVCDVDLGVLFSTPRALHLLGRLGTTEGDRALPECVTLVVRDQLAGTDSSRVDRVPVPRGGAAVLVHSVPLRGVAPARAAVWLREEVLRDDRLYATLKERYAISPRAFHLAQLVRQGLTNRQIAAHLRLTESTVKVYLHQLYRECGVPSRTALIALLDRWSR
ncbi:MAG: helix-turn-helix transcriptional regulator [Labilithrix sp.]|nr:helix-turn-helix transcriptional regulator [Labilithrix sp.]